jgi:hypothetical protein
MCVNGNVLGSISGILAVGRSFRFGDLPIKLNTEQRPTYLLKEVDNAPIHGQYSGYWRGL